MNTIKDLFFHLTPTTLAAIVADLHSEGDPGMSRVWSLALEAGYNNCGDEFNDMVVEARAARDAHRPDSDPKFTNNIEAILARQS